MGNTQSKDLADSFQAESRVNASCIEQLEEKCQIFFQRLPAPERETLEFVLREALINAVEAIGKDRVTENDQQTIRVDLQQMTDGTVEIRVIDEGKGLDSGWQEQLKEFDMGDILDKENGRGLLFIQAMVDEIWSCQDAEGKHVFGMRKWGGGES